MSRSPDNKDLLSRTSEPFEGPKRLLPGMDPAKSSDAALPGGSFPLKRHISMDGGMHADKAKAKGMVGRDRPEPHEAVRDRDGGLFRKENRQPAGFRVDHPASEKENRAPCRIDGFHCRQNVLDPKNGIRMGFSRRRPCRDVNRFRLCVIGTSIKTGPRLPEAAMRKASGTIRSSSDAAPALKLFLVIGRLNRYVSTS